MKRLLVSGVTIALMLMSVMNAGYVSAYTQQEAETRRSQADVERTSATANQEMADDMRTYALRARNGYGISPAISAMKTTAIQNMTAANKTSEEIQQLMGYVDASVAEGDWSMADSDDEYGVAEDHLSDGDGLLGANNYLYAAANNLWTTAWNFADAAWDEYHDAKNAFASSENFAGNAEQAYLSARELLDPWQ